ncbi:MAG: protein phosphatase 2C domain-containing protein [Pseudomonadota bacterium]
MTERSADDGILLLNGREGSDRRRAAMGGGELLAYTARAPDKQSDNEDTVASIPWGPDACVLVVADGAGGLPAGKRASMLAVTALAESLDVSLGKTTLLRTAILNGIEAANETVMAKAKGSATTMTIVTIEGLLARSYQVGDSEAVIAGQRGKIRLQTLAHSPTGFAVEAGFLDERDALHHAERHVVSNFVGNSDMRIDVGAAVTLNPRDTVLLASDGLTDNLHISEVVDRMRSGPLEDAAERIVSLAARRMADEDSLKPCKPDDLSLILFRKPYRRSSGPSGA